MLLSNYDKKQISHIYVTSILLCMFLTVIEKAEAEKNYSPSINQTYPDNVYWGDTHLHTNMSIDANGMANKALGPDEAYRFARGETIAAHNGMDVQLKRPLDFLVVADHAENIGVMPRLEAADPILLKTKTGQRWYQFLQQSPLKTKEILTADTGGPLSSAIDSIFNKGIHSFFWAGFGAKGSGFSTEKSVGYIGDENFRRSVWAEVTANAERYNEPDKFTALAGFEWSAGPSLHRVVVFRDGADKTNQVLPYSAIDSQNPEDLWAYLARYSVEFGGEALAIPHNSNLSAGRMFAVQDTNGRPLTLAYAKTRNRWEPLVEATQNKGDSETHPILSTTDNFADFETWGSPKNPENRKYEYVRSALKLGLKQQAKLGVNPFKYGMIGSTDAHTSMASADDNNFLGNTALTEPSRYRIKSKMTYVRGANFAASGYAAVWATENTREALFAAMKRKEVYASTGPRITVRFFGGWDYKANDALKPDLAKIGYAKGVPMGGDLTSGPKGKSPKFLIRAVKDPDGANLDRVQVIKGWHDKNGQLHEKSFNVALSDDRTPNWRGKVKPVGNTVDIEDASYTNSIGDPELAVVWTDPDFDKDELAFYYVRVLEIPTPRWTAYDAKFFGINGLPEEVPMVTQERAYTSSIWYSPK